MAEARDRLKENIKMGMNKRKRGFPGMKGLNAFQGQMRDRREEM